jgi:hypothetical protein
LASLNTPQHPLPARPRPLRCHWPGPQDCPGGGLGIETVSLALPAAGNLIRLVDLDHLDAGRPQMPGGIVALRRRASSPCLKVGT